MSKKADAATAVKEELESLVEDILELAKSSAGLDGEKLDSLKKGLHERVEQIRAGARRTVRSLAEKADDALETADDYAHENPWHLVIAAGLAGIAVGVLVARR